MHITHRFRIFRETFTLTPLTLILIAVVALRIPNLFEPYWYGDEAIYLALGEGVRQGLTLYKDIFDHKPPLIYVLAALSGSLFWFKFLLLVNHVATVILFSKLAKKLLSLSSVPERRQSKAAVLATAIFAIFTTLPTLEGNIANAELFLALPIVAGLLYVFSAGALTFKRSFLAGLIFSFAILYKVPAAFEVMALVAFWWISNLTKMGMYPKLLLQTFALGLGIFLPILGTAVYYWLQGALSQYLAAGFLQNFGYIARWAVPTVTPGEEGFSGNLTFRAGVLAAVTLAILFLRKFFDKATLFISLWFTFALFAMLLSGRPYPHYVIQAIAPLSLLVTILVNGNQKQRFWTTPFILLFLLSLTFYKFYYYPTLPYYQNFLSLVTGQKKHVDYLSHFDPRTPRTYELAQSLVSNTSPRDRIFIWGTNPELYALARRLPPGRYVTSFHISDFDGRDETANALSNNPPKYIILDLNETRDFPGLRSFLQSNYIYLETVDALEVWKKVNPEVLKVIR